MSGLASFDQHHRFLNDGEPLRLESERVSTSCERGAARIIKMPLPIGSGPRWGDCRVPCIRDALTGASGGATRKSRGPLAEGQVVAGHEVGKNAEGAVLTPV